MKTEEITTFALALGPAVTLILFSLPTSSDARCEFPSRLLNGKPPFLGATTANQAWNLPACADCADDRLQVRSSTMRPRQALNPLSSNGMLELGV